MKEKVTIRLDEKLIKDIKLIGLLEGETISFIIRTILQDYVNYYNHRKTNLNE